MSKSIPQLLKYMTTTPHSINSDQPLATASAMMKEYGIRHLPVMYAGQIKGVISDRDLKMAMSIRGVDASSTTVEDIATEDAFLIKPDAKLDDVVRIMADKRIGSVLVVDNHKLVGIFTTTDAMKAMDDLLNTRLS